MRKMNAYEEFIQEKDLEYHKAVSMKRFWLILQADKQIDFARDPLSDFVGSEIIKLKF